MFYYSITEMEKSNLEHRYAIQFCVELVEGFRKRLAMILSRAQVFLCRRDFVNAPETVEHEPRS
jgi:hypothetical protein